MSGSNINILETMRISNTKYIQVVKIGSKVFAIAVAKDTVTYLCELNEDELVYNESSSGKMLMNSESFKSCANASILLLIDALTISLQLSEPLQELCLPGKA